MLLTQGFFYQDAPAVAPQLLGHVLCRQLPSGEIKKGIIIETEAYMSTDPASHAYKGETVRNKAMFLDGGHSYVYLIYGMHHCLNVVTGKKGNGQGVLIRALEMIKQESCPNEETNKLHIRLASGPGKICRHLAINKEQNGMLLHPDNKLWLEERHQVNNFSISTSGRIGISVAKEKNWRFFITGNPAVSGKK